MALSSTFSDVAIKCQDLLLKCETHSRLENNGAIQSARGDFNIWCFGLGAVKKGKSSLDFAVKHRPDIRDVIFDLLYGLEESLEECLEIACQVNPTSEELRSESFSDSEDSDEPFDEEISNIKTILKQLNRIHVAIRRYGTTLRHQKADSRFSEAAQGPELLDFEQELKFTIHFSFNKFDLNEPIDSIDLEQSLSSIQKRMVHMNLMRRNRIYYATKEMRKALVDWKKQEDDEARAMRIVAAEMQLVGNLNFESFQMDTDRDERRAITTNDAKSVQSDPESRTQLVPINDKSVSNEHTAIDLGSNFRLKLNAAKKPPTVVTNITRIGSKQDYPLCPKFLSTDTLAPCPYCAEPLDIEYSRNNSRWSCIDPECKSVAELYATADDLTKHIKSSHGITRWVCDYCSSQLGPDQMAIFESQEDWCNHVTDSHSATLSKAQLDVLSIASKRAMISALKCPLCPFSTDQLQAEIPDHILEHMHSFALRSLPWGTGDEEMGSNRSGRNAASDDQGSQDEPTADKDSYELSLNVVTQSDQFEELCSILVETLRIDADEELQGAAKDVQGLLNKAIQSIDSQSKAVLFETCAPLVLRAQKIRTQMTQLKDEDDSLLTDELSRALSDDIQTILDTTQKLLRPKLPDVQRSGSHLEPNDALAMLRNNLGEPLFDEIHGRRLLRELGSHSSAIKLAAAFIRIQAPAMHVKGYIKLLKNRKMLLHNDRARNPSNLTVSPVWDITLQHLSHFGRKLFYLLYYLSISDHHNMSTAVLQVLYQSSCSEFQEQPATNTFEQIMSSLQDYGITRVYDSGKYVELDPAISILVNEQLRLDDEYDRWKELFVTFMGQHFPTPDFDNWSQCQRWLEQARTLLEYNAPESILDLWVGLMGKAGTYAYERGETRMARAMLEKARAALSVLTKPDHLTTICTVLRGLARVLMSLGEFDAAEEVLSSYGPAGRYMDKFDYSIGSQWTSAHELRLTTTAMWLSIYRKGTASRQFENSVEQSYGGIELDPGLDTEMKVIFATTFFLRGHYLTAVQMDRELVQSRAKHCGPTHPSTITSMSHLASSCFAAGLYAEAEKLELEASQLSRQTLGTRHPDTLTSLANLASIRWHRGQVENLNDHEQILSAQVEVLGAAHPSTLTSMHNVAIVNMYLNKLEEAHRLMRIVFEKRKDIYGHEHPDIILAGIGLADILSRLGKLVKAEDLVKEMTKSCLSNVDLPYQFVNEIIGVSVIILLNMDKVEDAVQLLGRRRDV